jgi:hypothetical protein
MRRIGLWLLATTALSLAACAPGGSPESTRSESASPPASPTASPPATSAPPAPSTGPATPSTPGGTAMLVQFGRQGGFAGVSDELMVRQDGSFTLVRTRPAVNRSGRLSAADLTELRRVLQASDFAALPRVQPAKGNDLFTYHVIHDGSEILAMDGGIDDRLKPVINTLSGIVAKYSA